MLDKMESLTSTQTNSSANNVANHNNIAMNLSVIGTYPKLRNCNPVEHSNGNLCCLISPSSKNNIMNKFYVNDMVNKFEINYNYKLNNENNVKMLIERAIHWCLVNGFVAIPKERKLNDLMVVTYLPFTLFPSPFSRSHFEQVFNLQPHINDLVHKISKSGDLIEKVFENLIKYDHFVSSLWKSYKHALQNGYNQKITFSILRCDYMLHENEVKDPLPASLLNDNGYLYEENYSMKQVEINTIAAGFGYVATKASQLHKEILKWTNSSNMLAKLPENNPLSKIANGFVEAWRLYDVENSIVLFIVLDYEINIADQRHLEYEIVSKESKIEIQRCTLADLNAHAYLNNDKALIYNNREVSIVYYRAGYAPEHFHSQNEWDALVKIEMSKAIKCPTIGTFLAGMKKFQEYLACKDNLLKICDNNQQLANMFDSVFAEFFNLDSEENIERVFNNPDNYVLKPQREGGGNNLYKSKIKDLITKMIELENNKSNEYNNVNQNDQKEDIYNKDLYIVMELLKPIISSNYIISPKSQLKQQNGKSNRLDKIKITNELGIYGVLVKNGEKTILNESCGYCLRSKPSDDNEGGVMCGSGALDSIYFID